MKRACLCLTALLLAGTRWPVPPAAAGEKVYRPALREADVERLLGEDHFGMYLLGKKIGWGRISFRKEDGKDPLIRVEMEGRGTLLILGAKQQMHFRYVREYDGKPPYAFRGGLSWQSDGEDTEEVRVARSGNGLAVTVRSAGEEIRKQIPVPDYTLADAAAVGVWVARGAKPGEQIATQEFDFDSLRMTGSVHKLKAEKAAVAGGVKVTYAEVESTDHEGVPMLARYNRADGRLVSVQIGGVFELRREPEKVARQTERGADLFKQGMVKVDRALGDPEEITALVLEVNANGETALKPGPRQGVVRAESGKVLVKLGKGYGPEVPATPEEAKEALAETTTYPLSHPRVRELAREAVGDAKTDREKVERLVKFVNGYITPSYTAEPLNLLKLIREKQGDCSEYALLFAALARAAGVPCREVGGLVYMGDAEKAFGPHAWNEVVLDGKWVPVDASVPQAEIDPTHVRYGSAAGDGMLNLAASFAGMSFRVVEVKRRGE